MHHLQEEGTSMWSAVSQLASPSGAMLTPLSRRADPARASPFQPWERLGSPAYALDLTDRIARLSAPWQDSAATAVGRSTAADGQEQLGCSPHLVGVPTLRAPAHSSHRSASVRPRTRSISPTASPASRHRGRTRPQRRSVDRRLPMARGSLAAHRTW